MKTVSFGICFGIAILSLSAPAAMSADRLVGKVSLTAVTSGCPTALTSAGQPVPVNFVLPEASPPAHPPVQNRFRYNYMTPASATRPVTISGQIANYGAPGCTVAFQGQVASLD